LFQETITVQEKHTIGNYYGFSSNNIQLVLRQEQAVLHMINASEIGKIIRQNSFGHSFDEDPIKKIFGKNKNIHNKKPDYCALVDKSNCIIIEYDENKNHEKSKERLNEICELFHLNINKEMNAYHSSSTLSSQLSPLPYLRNVYVIRINGHEDDDNKNVCFKKERKQTEGEYSHTNRYFELTEHGLTVVEETIVLLEKIYEQIVTEDDEEEHGLQIYEVNTKK
jgi:hypothetical protein